MDFKPSIKELRLITERIFAPEPMGLAADLLSLPLEERLTYQPEENLFFVNFEGYYVKTSRQIREIRRAVCDILDPVGRKVFTIVNYDNFNILPDLIDEYTEVVRNWSRKYYIQDHKQHLERLCADETGRCAPGKESNAPHVRNPERSGKGVE
jgi:propionate CoA-transferase